MTRVAICYGTSEGQTAAIAERIGDVVEGEGYGTALVHLNHPPSGFDPAAYDGIVVGASIHFGSHQGYVADFVREHRRTLNRRPSAFVSVSLSAAHENADERASAAAILESFLEETGWDPDGTLSAAGALAYSEYGFLTRLVMRWIAGRTSGDTDTGRDYEYTDWEEIEAFAREFTTLLEAERRDGGESRRSSRDET